MIKKLLIFLLLVPAIWAMEEPKKKELSPIRTILYLTRNKKWDKDSKKNFLYWYARLKINETKNLKELDLLHKEFLAIEDECRQSAQGKETVDLPLNLYQFDKALTTYGHEYLKFNNEKRKSTSDKLFKNKVYEILSFINEQLHNQNFIYHDVLERGINDNAGPWMSPPLLSVLNRLNEKLTTLLVDNGANVNVRNTLGQTSLSMAVLSEVLTLKNINLAKLIIESGSTNINDLNQHEVSVLHKAASCKEVEFVKYLLDQKSDVNIKGKNGWTPLHWAAHEGNMEVVLLLLQKNADPKIIDAACNTPAEIAKKANHLFVAQVIKAYQNGQTDLLWRLKHKIKKIKWRFRQS